VIGFVAVGLGGAFGALTRHLLDVALRRGTGIGPSTGVLVANGAGSLVLGMIVGWSTGHTLDPEVRRLVVVGFLGGLTTFSTLMVELVNLLDRPDGPDGHHGPWPALGWGLVSAVGGVGAAAAGFALGSTW